MLHDSSVAGRWAAATAVVLWSSGNVIVKRIDLSGLQIAFWRLLLAAIVYLAVFVASGRRPSPGGLARAVPTAVTVSLQIAVFFVALKATTVANATVIGALTPLVLLAVAARRFRESVGPMLVAAAVVALAGVGLVVFGSSGRPVWSVRGDLLAVVGMLLFAAYFALAKSVRQHLGTFELQTYTFVIGTAVLAPLAFIDAGGVTPPSLRQWMWLALVVAVPGTGHLLMNWSHQHTNLTFSSMLTLAVPALSTALAAWWLDESLVALQIVGMIVVIAALGVVVRLDVGAAPAVAGPRSAATRRSA